MRVSERDCAPKHAHILKWPLITDCKLKCRLKVSGPHYRAPVPSPRPELCFWPAGDLQANSSNQYFKCFLIHFCHILRHGFWCVINLIVWEPFWKVKFVKWTDYWLLIAKSLNPKQNVEDYCRILNRYEYHCSDIRGKTTKLIRLLWPHWFKHFNQMLPMYPWMFSSLRSLFWGKMKTYNTNDSVRPAEVKETLWWLYTKNKGS